MKLELNKTTEKPSPFILPGLTLLILMSTVHLVLPIAGDDVHYMRVARDMNSLNDLFSWIYGRFNRWSSRVIIEFVMILVSRHWLLWISSNIVMLLLLYYFLIKVFASKPDSKICWAGLFLILMYPFGHMGTAGFLATTLNYLWPLTFAVIAGYGIKKSIVNIKTIKIWEYPIYIGALIFASNAEQLNILLFGILLLLTGYTILIQKKINIHIIIQLIIVSAMLIFTLQAPGNANRYISEIRNWFPDYAMFGLIDRIQLGFAFTLSHFIFQPNLIFTVFCLLIYIVVHLENTDKFYRIIAAIPLGSAILFGIIQMIHPSIGITALSQFGMNTAWIINSTNFHRIHLYMCIFYLGFIVLCILASLYICFKNDGPYAWLIIALMLLGFTTGLIMGFSPTVYASSDRTRIFLYFTFIVCVIFLFQKIRLVNFKHESTLFLSICFLGVIHYFRFLAFLITW